MAGVGLTLLRLCVGHPQRLFSKDEPQFNLSSKANWNHSNMYAPSHLRTRPVSSFREAQVAYLVVLLSAPSLSSTSFISFLQNMGPSISPSLTRYLCSPPGYKSRSIVSSLINVVPQRPPEYEPFNLPLTHSIFLLTACSESLRVFALSFDF